jgi:protein O-GlcNAc transferase
VDIGANYGVYSLTAAALVGANGKVLSFEPASRTAEYLRASVRINGYKNLEVIQQALSKSPGQSYLSTHDNAELNRLQSAPGDAVEAVMVNTLDQFMALCPEQDVDFVKLDAEGEESNIITGGQHFFSENSPLVMFEIKSSSTLNFGLISEFQLMGYECYKLIPGIGALAPHDADGPIDPSTLNLFACKHDRAERLEKRGLLTRRDSLFHTDTPEPQDDLHLRWLSQKPATRKLVQVWENPAITRKNGWDAHRHAMNFFAFSQAKEFDITERFLALRQAALLMENLADPELSAPRVCTRVRIMRSMGRRISALAAIDSLPKLLGESGLRDFTEPFVPLNPEFEQLDPADRLGDWMVASILETRRVLQHYSSYFNPRDALDLLKRAAPLGFQQESINHRIRVIEKAFPAVEARSTSPGRLAELLPDLESPIYIVDVGALMLDTDSPAPYSRLVDDGLATVVGFEPNVAACDDLNTHYQRQGVGHRFFPYFIGDGRPGVYYETNMVMTGSLYRPNSEVMAHYMNLKELCEIVAEHPVTTRRLDDLSLPGPVDYIKIDVQGAELSVFQGASTALRTALFIHTEVEFAELYEGQPLFAEVDQHLRNAGFQFHTFVGLGQRSFKPMIFQNNINAGLRQILWADALYIRDVRLFKNLRDDQLIKLALIAHEIYQSFDLAHLALKMLDAQRNSHYARSYFALLQSQEPNLKIRV